MAEKEDVATVVKDSSKEVDLKQRKTREKNAPEKGEEKSEGGASEKALPLNKMELKIPIFSVVTKLDGNQFIIVVGGGGGNSKTGIPNEIISIRPQLKDHDVELEQVFSHSTHPSPPHSMAFHPTENWFGCGLDSEFCHFKYESDKFEEIKRIQTNHDPAEDGYQKCFSFSKDGKLIATGGTEGVVRVWNFPELSLKKEFKVQKEINSISFDPESRIVANTTNTIFVWELEKDKELNAILSKDLRQREEFNFRNTLIRQTAENLTIISSDNARSKKAARISEWDLLSGDLIRSIQVHNRPITAFVLSPNGEYLGFGLSDGGIGVLEMRSYRIYFKKQDLHGLAVTSVAFLQLASASKITHSYIVSGAPDRQLIVTRIQRDKDDNNPFFYLFGLSVMISCILIFYFKAIEAGISPEFFEIPKQLLFSMNKLLE